TLTLGIRCRKLTPDATPDTRCDTQRLHGATPVRKATPTPPKKPNADSPLFPHHNGQWAKKIKGKLHYFGTWDNPQCALDKWLDERDDLLAGRVPRKRAAAGGVI